MKMEVVSMKNKITGIPISTNSSPPVPLQLFGDDLEDVNTYADHVAAT